jgi:2-iminobutanoate/2-iminopropanoate deaminase
MADKTPITTANAPAAVGPYSQGVKANGFVFTAGQLGIDPATKQMAEGVGAQATQALANVKAVLEAAGSSMDKIVKTTVFLQHMDDFATVNAAYQAVFDAVGAPYPSRSAVEVAKLPLGGLVEIEVVALAD